MIRHPRTTGTLSAPGTSHLARPPGGNVLHSRRCTQPLPPGWPSAGRGSSGSNSATAGRRPPGNLFDPVRQVTQESLPPGRFVSTVGQGEVAVQARPDLGCNLLPM